MVKQVQTMSNDKTQPKPAPNNPAPGVQVTTNDPTKAIDQGMPLLFPEGAFVEYFAFDEVSKGGQYRFLQERELPAEILKAAPYLKGTLRPALFNEYRGNAGMYLTGQTMIGRGFNDPAKQMRRIAIIVVPL
jgi:hypothetical protein